MADNTGATAIALVALSTAVFTGVALILKNIKHSECSKCCKIDTRTPTTRTPPPSPTTLTTLPTLHRERKNAEREGEKKSKLDVDSEVFV